MNILASFEVFLLLLLFSSGGVITGADAAETTPPRLSALALVFGNNDDVNNNTAVVPTFNPNVTMGYVANVTDAVFELAVGYTPEGGWEANLSVSVTVAPGSYSTSNMGVVTTGVHDSCFLA